MHQFRDPLVPQYNIPIASEAHEAEIRTIEHIATINQLKIDVRTLIRRKTIGGILSETAPLSHHNHSNTVNAGFACPTWEDTPRN